MQLKCGTPVETAVGQWHWFQKGPGGWGERMFSWPHDFLQLDAIGVRSFILADELIMWHTRSLQALYRTFRERVAVVSTPAAERMLSVE